MKAGEQSILPPPPFSPPPCPGQIEELERELKEVRLESKKQVVEARREAQDALLRFVREGWRVEVMKARRGRHRTPCSGVGGWAASLKHQSLLPTPLSVTNTSACLPACLPQAPPTNASPLSVSDTSACLGHACLPAYLCLAEP